jgi:hypothetical protein
MTDHPSIHPTLQITISVPRKELSQTVASPFLNVVFDDDLRSAARQIVQVGDLCYCCVAMMCCCDVLL